MPQEQHRATSRILDLLELLSGANGAGYTLTELSQALHIPKSSLFSIIHTLEERRYVHCDKHSGQYSIGISAYVLGTSFPAEQSLAVLHRVMEEVVARCRETCQLGVLDQGNILYLEKVDSPQAIRLISRVGDRLPANATALGKALLDEFCAATGAINRSVIYSASQTGFNWSDSPVVTVEMGYLSNPQEDTKLCRASYQDACAAGIYNGIIKYMNGRDEQ